MRLQLTKIEAGMKFEAGLKSKAGCEPSLAFKFQNDFAVKSLRKSKMSIQTKE